MQKWITGLLGSIGAVLLATAVAWAGSDQGILYNDLSVFVWCGVFAFAVQWLIFIHAWFAQTEHFFDLTGSLTYIVLVLAACYLSEAFDIRSMVIVGLVLIWALPAGAISLFPHSKGGRGPSFSQHQGIVSNILHDLDASGCLGVRYRQCGSWSHNLQQQSRS